MISESMPSGHRVISWWVVKAQRVVWYETEYGRPDHTMPEIVSGLEVQVLAKDVQTAIDAVNDSYPGYRVRSVEIRTPSKEYVTGGYTIDIINTYE